MTRDRVTSSAPWEGLYGYCRAIKAGNHIYVSGTAPVDDNGDTFAADDQYAQTKRCLEIALLAVSNLGGSIEDVVRTRMYVTDISRSEEHGKAHGELFKDCPPACTMVEVSNLISPDMTIEVELEAILNA